MPVFLALLAGCAAPAREHEAPVGWEPASARKLYVTKCARCHKLYDPSKYSDAEWQKWMTKMTKKAKLTPAQEEVLTQYIEQAIRKPSQ